MRPVDVTTNEGGDVLKSNHDNRSSSSIRDNHPKLPSNLNNYVIQNKAALHHVTWLVSYTYVAAGLEA